MTYCLGITTRQGMVLTSDSRTNASYEQISVCRRTSVFEAPGERVFVLLASGSLSLTQTVVTLLGRDFDAGRGLAQAETAYDAARLVGDVVRRVSDLDLAALERDKFRFNVHFILGSQIAGQAHDLYLVPPEGEPVRATEEEPFLQTGESKYGRPILVRGIRYEETPLEEAAKYAVISMDSTMRSNVSVGPPIDLIVYERDTLQITKRRRLTSLDPDLREIHVQWDQALRRAVTDLPEIDFETFGQKV